MTDSNTNTVTKVNHTLIKDQDYDYDTLIKEYKTKSAVIRFLHSKEFKNADIARFMNIRYQHVRNVLTEPTKQ